ncbi:MAG: glycosyltransferase family 9 protein [Chitinophagaceae bacterium]|nr:MAG: glycosyltransferase family 9 protein [Chitinophagaceae bacterium]
MNPENIIISRTDSIGDVVLTLPMAKIIKDHFPGCRVAFLGKEYTRPVIKSCSYIDQFISLNDFMRKDVLIGNSRPQNIIHVLPSKPVARRAKELGIPLRIGTANRLFHLTTCNKLVRLSRKKSDLHEAQLNLKLLSPFGITELFDLQKLQGDFGLDRIQPLSPALSKLLDPNRYNLILHPKSQGNGREWGLGNFIALVNLLDPARFKIFVSGTEAERPLLQPLFEHVKDRVTDITGQMDLYQFMSFIKRADGLLASGTGPLHLAAALGRDAFGIFPPIRPIHPGRWAPLGPGVKVFVSPDSCRDCNKKNATCHCMSGVQPAEVMSELDSRAGLKARPSQFA